jgi:flagellar hook-associated protein 1 FlgK
VTSLFGILGVGANGLAANAFGTNVASQNASNVGTDGYSRRLAILEPLGGPPEAGAGARATGARRILDGLLDRRILGARAAAGAASAGARTLEVLDAVLAEGAGSVGDAMDALATAIADLAAHPDDRAARTVVLARSDALAQAFSSAAGAIAESRSDANQHVAADVRALDETLREIASLGTQISRAELGGAEASDLRDRRDELVRQVSDRVPVTRIEDASGRITLLLGGSIPLVSLDGQVGELEAATDPATGDMRIFAVAAGARVDVTDRIDSGSIGGTIAARDGALAQAAADLDQLAYDFATAWNAAHTAGFGLDGGTGRNLFEPPAAVAGAASGLAVSADVVEQPDFLAAAAAGADLPGDNRGALALQALADARIALGGTATLGDGLSALIGSAGAALQGASADEEYAAMAAAQLADLRESVSGVSLDDEMVALTRYQRAYQASLRVVQVADEMLGELMELGR